MKHLHLFFSILMILSILFFCGQMPQNNEQPNEHSTIFVAAMQNMNVMNTYLERSNKDVLESMGVVTEIKKQYLPITQTALKIQELSQKFNQQIVQLKELLGKESSGLYTSLEAEAKDNLNLIGLPKDGSNKEAVKKVFQEQGPALYQKLNQLKKDYLQQVDNLWDSWISSTIFVDPSKKYDLKKKWFTPLFLSSNKAKTENIWVKENFEDKTIEEVFIALTNLQNQVNLSSNSTIRSLSEQIGRLGINFDRLGISVQSPKNTVVLGDTFEAKITLQAYSSQIKTSFSVDGEELNHEEGQAIYKTQANELGEHNYNAKIYIKNPLTGETNIFKQMFTYQVTSPNVSEANNINNAKSVPSLNVVASQQNIFYLAVNNPITITLTGTSDTDLNVESSNGKITKVSSNNYLYVPEKLGKVTLTITNTKNGKTFLFQSRVKRIPDPIVKLGTKVDGLIAADAFKAQLGLSAWLENFDFDARCIVQSYTMSYLRKQKSVVEFKGTGTRFSGKIAAVVKQAKPGDYYIFTNVRAKCPGDHSDRRVNGLSFMIK